MPGTARASSWPRTSRSTPARGIGSIITPDAAASRREVVERQPERVAQDHLLEAHTDAEAQASASTARRSSGRRARASTRARRATRSSAWTGPSRSPSAAQASAVVRASAATISAGSRDGVTKIVSSKYGPSSGSGLSKTASDLERAVAQEPLERHLGARHVALDQQRPVRVLPASARIARTRAAAAAAARGSSARITPRLADSDSGFTTQGSPISAATAAESSLGPTVRYAAAALRRRRARAASQPCRASPPRPPAGCATARGRVAASAATQHSLVVDGHDRVERPLLRHRRDRFRGRLRAGAGRASTGASPIDTSRPLGRHHDLDPERPGGGKEVGRPVGGRRQQEEHASHTVSIGAGR